MLKEIFGKETMGRIQDGSPKVVQPTPDSKCSEHPSTNKTYKNVGRVKEPFLKNRRISSHEVANSLELHTGQFRAFLRKI
jgi:hypothetical protein